MDYSQLKPGLYLQQGETVKSIGVGDFWGQYSISSELDDLARYVVWVFVALNEREKVIRELLDVGQWFQDGEPVDSFPLPFNWQREFVRIDAALQLGGNAYLLKQRDFGDNVAGLRWLNPVDVTPQNKTAIFGDLVYTNYLYKGGKNLPGEDVIYFYKPGQTEIGGDITAGVATKIVSQILYGMGQVFTTLYDNNALPIMLVNVPPATSDNDKDTLERRFKRLFNMRSGSKENRTIGVREGVTVQQLQLSPDSLNSQPLEEMSIRGILAAHDVPYDLIFGSANYATAADVRRGMISGMGQRVSYIAETLLLDPELAELNLTYSVNLSKHWSMQSDLLDTADAFLRLVSGGFTTEAAAIIAGLGIDGLENLDNIYTPPQNVDQTQLSTSLVGKSFMKEAETKQFTRWYKKRLGADVDLFDSVLLTKKDKLFIADKILRSTVENYP